MGYSHGFKWSYEVALKKVKKCVDIMDYDYMPTNEQINSFYGNSGLSNKLSKKPEWRRLIMKELDLNLKNSETSRGKQYEQLAYKILISKGYDIDKMTNGQHFDFLVNEVVKVDVKCAKRWYTKGYQVNSFGINKKYATCDVYMLFALNDEEEVDRTFIIPSLLLKNKTTMSIGKSSKYDKWINRYDVLDSYIKFLSDISTSV